MPFVSRAGDKLEHALKEFGVNPAGWVCADFGSSTGGFVDCLLQHGTAKVYSVETGYGTLDWKLRNDERVTVMERTNAMHVVLPEKCDLITIDTSWTKLEKIVPNALNNLKSKGTIIALVKPHYEAGPRMIRKGKLQEEFIPEVLESVKKKMEELHLIVEKTTESPILGAKGSNREFFSLLSFGHK